MNRLKEIKELKRQSEEFQLEGREIIGKYTMAELAAIYNGIGPDAWSSRFRRLVTYLLNSFELAAMPHDYEYGTAPRTY